MKVFKVSSLKDYEKLFKELLKVDAKLFFLKGGLGAGKTTFVREFLSYKFNLNDKEVFELGVASPTYSIINEYEYKNKNFTHGDFYRVTPDSFDIEEVLELIEGSDLSFFEWEEKINLKENLQEIKNICTLYFNEKENQLREIQVCVS